MDRPEIILAPGPTPIPPEVLLAQGSPLVYHRGPGFGAIMRDVTARLQELYRTEAADVLLMTSSAARAALESAIAELLLARRRGAGAASPDSSPSGSRRSRRPTGSRCTRSTTSGATKIRPDDVAAALAEHPRQGRAAHAVRDLDRGDPADRAAREGRQRRRRAGDRRRRVLARRGAVRLRRLGHRRRGGRLAEGPAAPRRASRSPRSASARGKPRAPPPTRASTSTGPPTSGSPTCPTPRTRGRPAISVMQGLQAALELYFQDGVEAAMARHQMLSRAVKEGAKALGLDLFGEGLDDNWTVTAIRAPEIGRRRHDQRHDPRRPRLRARPRPGAAEGQGLPHRPLRILQRARHPARPGGAGDDARVARAPGEARRRRGGRRDGLHGARGADRPCGSWSPSSSPSKGSSCSAAISRSTCAPSSPPATSPREIAPYDALIVRSATQVTEEVLARRPTSRWSLAPGSVWTTWMSTPRRAAACMVVNAPQSNVISAAEQTMALLLAQARNIPQAHAALQGRAVGAVGVGGRGARRQDDRPDRARSRRGARRTARGGVRHARDRLRPVRLADRAKEMGVDVMPSLEALLVQADFVSIHLPRTAGDRRADRRARALADEAGRSAGEHRARRHRRRGRAREGARERPSRRRRPRRVRDRAHHRLAALRARQRRRDPAPGRLAPGGAGQGGHHGRRDGSAGAGGRVRALRGQRRRQAPR